MATAAVVEKLQLQLIQELGMSRPGVITRNDVRRACRAHKQYSAADRARAEKEEVKKAAAMRIFEPLLGVKTEDEVRAMSPDEVRRLARRRIREGLVTLKGISADALLEMIQKSKSERRPSWYDAFVALAGETGVNKVRQATPETFSYKFVG